MLSLAVGAAIDRGCLRSLDQTLGELLGPSVVTDPQKAAITLRHLLTMTSGPDFPETASYTNGSGLYQTWLNAPDQLVRIQAMTRTQVSNGAGMPTPTCGYAPWLGQASSLEFVLAIGGQFIMVAPAKQFVVTAAARAAGVDTNTALAQSQRIFDIITGHIVPAF